MRLALIVFIIFACGCIPSPTKPLGVSESTSSVTESSQNDVVPAVEPASNEQTEVTNATNVTNELDPEPFSLAPPAASDTSAEPAELSPDDEFQGAESQLELGPIDAAQPLRSDVGSAAEDLVADPPLSFSLDPRRSQEGTLKSSAPEAELPSMSQMTEATSQSPDELPSNSELTESATKEIVNRAGQAVESVIGSLLPMAPASVEQADRATDTMQQFTAGPGDLAQDRLPESDRFLRDDSEPVGFVDHSLDVSDLNGSTADRELRNSFDSATQSPMTAEHADLPNRSEPTRLIPRDVLFGAPQRARPRLSPDGRRLAFLAPKNGVLNIWVAPIDQVDQAVALTSETEHDIRNFFWAYTNEHVLYSHAEQADQNYHVYAIDIRDGTVKNLTPLEAASARIESVSDRFPTEVLIGINDRVPHQYYDLYRVNLLTGQRQLVLENPGFASLLADDEYRVRFALQYTPDGGQLIVRQDGRDPRGWSAYLQLAPEDAMTTSIVGFDKSGDRIYLRDSRNRDTSALRVIDLNTSQEATLAENRFADVGSVMMHPSEKHVEAVTFNFQRPEWQVLDAQLRPDFEYLESVADGDVQIASRTLDDHAWVVAYEMDDGPIRYYHYRRDPREATLLFTSNSDLLRQPLVPMTPVVIKSRDGLDLVSYYSLPSASDPTASGKPTAPLPLVLDVHDGPWTRDVWGFDPVHQLLANRGYAVLSVNFRGSTGFGKSFVNAANGEWAGKMHSDLLDAIEWAVQEGMADRDRIGIMGGSYGGYAALVGLSFTPDRFACGIDIGGPANLETLLANPPSQWRPMMPLLNRRITTIETENGRDFARSHSPLTFANRIAKPLLIVDPAMQHVDRQAESRRLVSSLNQNRVPVTYLAFPNRSHGLAAPANRLAFYAVAEAFLAEHLGGRYQPIDGLLQQADLQVPVGSEQIPGLRVALAGSDGKEPEVDQAARESIPPDADRY